MNHSSLDKEKLSPEDGQQNLHRDCSDVCALCC